MSFENMQPLLLRYKSEIDWCEKHPNQKWWFKPSITEPPVYVDINRVISCKSKAEFRKLLETEYAISKVMP